MPYKSEKIIIAGTAYDRRLRLTEEERKLLIKDRKAKMSYNKLAVKYRISKRLAYFICNPSKYEEAKSANRERRADGRYTPPKEERNRIMQDIRHYKQQLKLQGAI